MHAHALTSSTFGSASLGCGAVAPIRPRVEETPAMVARRRGLVGNDLVGYGAVLAAFRFSAWAHEQHHFPTPELVQHHFGVSRATAYRWCRALAEAYGFRINPRAKGERGMPVQLTRTEA